VLTGVLGIAGAFVATWIGQGVGWYRPDQGAGLIGATFGALVVLFIWHRLAVQRLVNDPGTSRAGLPPAIKPHSRSCSMGLLDVLNGMQNGPRGQPQPATPGSGGMSKTTMALLAFLAYKAYRSFSGSQSAQAGAPSRYPSPQSADPYRDEPEGGLAGILRSIFGGGPVPGKVLGRGVGNTIQDLEQRGLGEIARSWVGRGPNRPI